MRRIPGIFFLFVLVAWVATGALAAEKEWTWMVFLNADNNLDSFGVKDQEEMAKVGSNQWLNVVSLIDRRDGPASLNYIEKGQITEVQNMGELDMGDYKQLVSFVQDVVKRYPAKRYALIVWNHGSGWNKTKAPMKGISYDDSSGNHITTNQLGEALKTIKNNLGHNLDILAMDACLMQMMEVAYAVRESCDFLVASEETEPGDGYPYDLILSGLTKSMTTPAFCAHIVKSYADSYNHETPGDDDGGYGGDDLTGKKTGSPVKRTTQSAVACAAIPALKIALDDWAKVVMTMNAAPQMSKALDEVECFYYSDNKDLVHFVSLLKGADSDEGFQKATLALEKALHTAIIANGTTGEPATNEPDEPPSDDAGLRSINAGGLAIYFPKTPYGFQPDYENLDFAKESLWNEMIKDYYKKSVTAKILNDLAANDVSGLRDYVRLAGSSPQEISSYVTSQVLFKLFCESSRNEAIRVPVTNLLRELKGK